MVHPATARPRADVRRRQVAQRKDQASWARSPFRESASRSDRSASSRDANLDIENGSFVVFVGPSGCGKTTLLRLIAGLEDVTGGQIPDRTATMWLTFPRQARAVDGVSVLCALSAHERPRQHRVRPENGRAAARRDRPQGGRRRSHAQPDALSRSQAARPFRRTTPARRDRPPPSCASRRHFCFDEPLSNLDAALRVQMRMEVTKLQKQLGTTAVYVTHDQVEAMTMADKIVVLNAGRIEQYGSPLELSSGRRTCSSPASSVRPR